MLSSTRKEDVRNWKTENILYNSMFTLLERNNFKKITVRNLCEEAQISRATFYTHFIDKYDLLQFFLAEIRMSLIKDVYKYNEMERDINDFVLSNKKVIINVLNEANSETLMLIREFMGAIVNLTIKRKTNDETSPNYIILLNFATGGLVNLLTWIVENNFPPEVNMMNVYLYKMMEEITVWDAEQEENPPDI